MTWRIVTTTDELIAWGSIAVVVGVLAAMAAGLFSGWGNGPKRRKRRRD